MKILTLDTLRSWDPCYDPVRYFDDQWSGTIIDVLKDSRISVPDRFWAALRTELVSEKLMRLFAVWCARQVQHLMTDGRSLAALEVAERFANGEATGVERAAAEAAVWAAAARAAAWAAAWAAAARADARADARAAQIAKLIEMIEAEQRDGRDELLLR